MTIQLTRQTANVVVSLLFLLASQQVSYMDNSHLDSSRRPLEGDTFNDIRVQSSLKKPLHFGAGVFSGSFNLGHFLFKHLDKSVANKFPFLLWFCDTLETIQEALRCIDNRQVNAKMFVKPLLDILAFVQSHASVVNENGVETIADSLLHQLGGNSRVDTTANGAEHMVLVAYQLADSLDLLVDKLGHGPVLLGAADIHGKVLQQLSSIGCVL